MDKRILIEIYFQTFNTLYSESIRSLLEIKFACEKKEQKCDMIIITYIELNESKRDEQVSVYRK
jgi:hypothetical protein